MDYSIIKQKQNEFLEKIWPSSIMRLGDLTTAGENVFRYAGREMLATKQFSNKYDELIGVEYNQKNIVTQASGKTGLKNFRNYMNAASDIHQARQVVVIASPKERQLVNIIPLVKEYISPQLFFDFADMMAEQTKSHYELAEFNKTESSGVTLYFNRNNPHIVSFCKDEDFIDDGFYLSWNPASVDLGHFYTRLICTNGQKETVMHSDAHLYSLNSSDMRRMINAVNNQDFSQHSTLKEKVMKSINTRISLNEMMKAQKILLGAGIDAELSESVIPYRDALEKYQLALGYKISKNMNKYKGPGTIWESYNALTAFASHTDSMDADDPRRGQIMSAAFSFLGRKPDIVETQYIDIF